MNESESAQTDTEPGFDDLFSSYDEQEDFIQRKDDDYSLSKRIEYDAEFWWVADMDNIDESEFVLPSASCYGLFANWKLHPNGKHVYGYRLRGFGGFTAEEKTVAGNGVYLSMKPFDSEDSDQLAVRHAFQPPMHPLMVVNESVYLESRPELGFQPIRPEDSAWLKLCKAATQRSCRINKGKWDIQAAADMLTKMLWEAGYDSIYFNTSGRPWVVLLMPGRPLAAQSTTRKDSPQSSTQSDSTLAQPIHVVINVSFESQKIIEVELPTTSRQWPFLWGMTSQDDGWEIHDWPSADNKTEIDQDIRLETASLKFFFVQDSMDGNAVPFAEVSCCPRAPNLRLLTEIGRDAIEVETCGFYASKEVSSDLASLPGIQVNSEFLTIGKLKLGPWDFEDAEWDQSYGFQWFWNGKSLPFHPSLLFDPPRGMAFGEWQKLIREADYIRRHTAHPQATCHTKVAALVSPCNEIFIEWLLMLPDEHMRNLGLLSQTIEWIERERQLNLI